MANRLEQHNEKEVWTAFGLLIKQLFTKIELKRLEFRALAAQRDILLPRLVCGEVRVESTGAHFN